MPDFCPRCGASWQCDCAGHYLDTGSEWHRVEPDGTVHGALADIISSRMNPPRSTEETQWHFEDARAHADVRGNLPRPDPDAWFFNSCPLPESKVASIDRGSWNADFTDIVERIGTQIVDAFQLPAVAVQQASNAMVDQVKQQADAFNRMWNAQIRQIVDAFEQTFIEVNAEIVALIDSAIAEDERRTHYSAQPQIARWYRAPVRRCSWRAALRPAARAPPGMRPSFCDRAEWPGSIDPGRFFVLRCRQMWGTVYVGLLIVGGLLLVYLLFAIVTVLFAPRPLDPPDDTPAGSPPQRRTGRMRCWPLASRSQRRRSADRHK